MIGKTKRFLIGVVAAFLLFLSMASARAQLIGSVSISGTELIQGKTNSNGMIVTKPITRTITTAAIFKQLAIDETTAGQWTNNAFPLGTTLSYSFWDGIFIVFAGPGNPLVVPTNIMTLTIGGSNGVYTATNFYSGAYNQCSVQVATLSYDATPFGGTMKFSMTGLATVKSLQTNPGTWKGYIDAESIIFTNGVGQGINAEGLNFVLRDVYFNASGKQRFYGDTTITAGLTENDPPPATVINLVGLQSQTVSAPIPLRLPNPGLTNVSPQ
jgi:hypothetical protein